MSQTDQEKKLLVYTFVSEENFRKYNVQIAKKLGGIEYAILLNDLVDQFRHLEKNKMLVSHIKYGDGLMYYTQTQAFDRCAISRSSFEKGLEILVDLGIIDTIVKFGVPMKRYFRINMIAIYDWLVSNKDYRMLKSTNCNVEINKLKCGNQHRNDKYNESKEEIYNRSPYSPPPESKKSSSFKEKEIASFDPVTYRLRNGQPLKQVTAMSLRKKMRDPKFSFIILSNIAWYEKQIDSGVKPKKSHEAFLQFAITNDMASKDELSWRNEMYAKIVKEEYKLSGMKILKTVVQMDKKDGSKPESISLNLPEETFSNIIQQFALNQGNK